MFSLIGGSWPPAPREPARPEYRSAPIPRHHTMQRPSHTERVKSVNLIEHLVTDRRRNKQAAGYISNVTDSSPQKSKMGLEPKKIETGILVGMSVSIFLSLFYVAQKKSYLCKNCKNCLNNNNVNQKPTLSNII